MMVMNEVFTIKMTGAMAYLSRDVQQCIVSVTVIIRRLTVTLTCGALRCFPLLRE